MERESDAVAAKLDHEAVLDQRDAKHLFTPRPKPVTRGRATYGTMTIAVCKALHLARRPLTCGQIAALMRVEMPAFTHYNRTLPRAVSNAVRNNQALFTRIQDHESNPRHPIVRWKPTLIGRAVAVRNGPHGVRPDADAFSPSDDPDPSDPSD